MKKSDIFNIIKPENNVEKEIISDELYIEGCDYGRSRPGHPEGKIIYHIEEVLANVDKFSTEENRTKLRLIALVHDTFKYKVDNTKPKSGENHHAMMARRFAERFHLSNDILEIIELHDEAYNAWQQIARKTEYHALERAKKLMARLDNNIDLYLAFYKCDNLTGDKEQVNYEWFLDLVNEKDNW